MNLLLRPIDGPGGPRVLPRIVRQQRRPEWLRRELDDEELVVILAL